MSKKHKTKNPEKIMSADKLHYTMTPKELHMGLYTMAYLATWAGEQFGGGVSGAECAIRAAQSRAEEIGTAITIANRLFENADPLEAA